MPRSCRLPLVLASLLLAGCGSTYNGRYAWRPGLVEVPLDAGGDAAPRGRMLVTVVGLRRADVEAGSPASIEVRLLVQNDEDRPVRAEVTTIELVAENLESFPTPTFASSRTLDLAPATGGTVTARFPFPAAGVPGPYDLGTLNLRWTLSVDGASVSDSATFERAARRATAWSDDPYWRYGFYGHRHHRRFHRSWFHAPYCD